MGKKAKGDRTKRESKVLVVFTDAERAKVQKRAEAKGLPIATFLRTLALDDVQRATV